MVKANRADFNNRRGNQLRICRTWASAVICLLLSAVGAHASAAGIVTVDVAKKSAKSDVATLDPRKVRVINEQVGVNIQSTLLTSQKVLIKFNGLKDQDYDVYVNGDFVGAKSAKELADGLERTTPATIADPAVTRCLNAVKDKVKEAYDNLHAREDPESLRAGYTLDQATGWINSGVQVEAQYRSVEVIVAPAGKPLAYMVFYIRRTAEEASETLRRVCELLQNARDRMYKNLEDPALRNYVVDALTPVSLSATYSLVNGKPRVTAKLVNDVDFPISGKLSIAAPQGWKTRASKLTFAELASGKTFTATADLEPIKKGAKPPASISVSGDVSLAGGKFEAKLHLKATATLKKP